MVLAASTLSLSLSLSGRTAVEQVEDLSVHAPAEGMKENNLWNLSIQ
jgi:hypothetical protein